jgi:hypothetical protein
LITSQVEVLPTNLQMHKAVSRHKRIMCMK